VSRYQKGNTKLDFTEARDSEWQWHQLGHMQVCTSLRTDNHASIPPLSVLQAGCPSCRPTNSVKALKARALTHSTIIDKSQLRLPRETNAGLWTGGLVTFVAPLLTKRNWSYYRYNEHQKMCGLHWEYQPPRRRLRQSQRRRRHLSRLGYEESRR